MTSQTNVSAQDEIALGDIKKSPSDLTTIASRACVQSSSPSVLEEARAGDDIPQTTTDVSASAPAEISPEARKLQKKEELKGFCALLFFIFLAGWNDGTPGALNTFKVFKVWKKWKSVYGC